MNHSVVMVQTGQVLRGLSLAEAGDYVSTGRARWLTDVPGIVQDVPAAVATAQPARAAGQEERAPEQPNGEIDDPLSKPARPARSRARRKKR